MEDDDGEKGGESESDSEILDVGLMESKLSDSSWDFPRIQRAREIESEQACGCFIRALPTHLTVACVYSSLLSRPLSFVHIRPVCLPD